MLGSAPHCGRAPQRDRVGKLAQGEPDRRPRQSVRAPLRSTASGRDPLAEKRRDDMPTFREAAKKVLDTNRGRWRSDRTATLWWASLENHAFPIIGGMAVDRISQSDVLRCVEPMWATRTETARKVRQRIRMVLRWCQAHGYVTFNMAGKGIDGALPARPATPHGMKSTSQPASGISLLTKRRPHQSTGCP